MNKRLIGGKFGIEVCVSSTDQSAQAPWLFAPGNVYLISGRAAMLLLAQTLSVSRVWLPSYLCPSMLEPLTTLGLETRIFPVGADLGIGDHGWVTEAREGDLVIYIDYFGFSDPAFPREELLARGCFLLRDASQALLSEPSTHAHEYQIFSPRKSVGVVDGGILIPNADGWRAEQPLEEMPTEWFSIARSAAEQRAGFDRKNGGSKRWRELFDIAEQTMPLGLFAMSDLSKKILGTVDFASVSQARKQNFQVLLAGLEDLALFKELPDGVVPLGFPVAVDRRDALQAWLFGHDIFPPVHWKLDSVIPPEFAESRRLSGHIMTLPCDHRYSESDMEYVVRTVREFQA